MRQNNLAKNITVFILALIIAASVVRTSYTNRIDKDGTRLDISVIPDGLYKGTCTYMGIFTCWVEVQIKNHKITAINAYEGRESTYVEKAKTVIHRVLDKQSTKVDAISGATFTSKAILTAIEKALIIEK